MSTLNYRPNCELSWYTPNLTHFLFRLCDVKIHRIMIIVMVIVGVRVIAMGLYGGEL